MNRFLTLYASLFALCAADVTVAPWWERRFASVDAIVDSLDGCFRVVSYKPDHVFKFGKEGIPVSQSATQADTSRFHRLFDKRTGEMLGESDVGRSCRDSENIAWYEESYDGTRLLRLPQQLDIYTNRCASPELKATLAGATSRI